MAGKNEHSRGWEGPALCSGNPPLKSLRRPKLRLCQTIVAPLRDCRRTHANSGGNPDWTLPTEILPQCAEAVYWRWPLRGGKGAGYQALQEAPRRSA